MRTADRSKRLRDCSCAFGAKLKLRTSRINGRTWVWVYPHVEGDWDGEFCRWHKAILLCLLWMKRSCGRTPALSRVREAGGYDPAVTPHPVPQLRTSHSTNPKSPLIGSKKPGLEAACRSPRFEPWHGGHERATEGGQTFHSASLDTNVPKQNQSDDESSRWNIFEVHARTAHLQLSNAFRNDSNIVDK